MNQNLRNSQMLKEQQMKRQSQQEEQARITRALGGVNPVTENAIKVISINEDENEIIVKVGNNEADTLSVELIDTLNESQMIKLAEQLELVDPDTISPDDESGVALVYDALLGIFVEEDLDDELDEIEDDEDDDASEFEEDEDDDASEFEDDEDDSEFEDDDDDEDAEIADEFLHHSGELEADEFDYHHVPLSTEATPFELETATSISDLIKLSVQEKFVQSVEANVELNVFIDLSCGEAFSEFSPKSLRKVSVSDQFDAFNVWNPLHRKNNGLILEGVQTISSYLNTLSNTPALIVGTVDDCDATLSILAESVNKVVNQSLADSVGLESAEQLTSPIIEVVMEGFESEESEESEEDDDMMDLEDAPTLDLSVNDIIRATTHVTKISSGDCLTAATVVVNLSLSIPALVHSSTSTEDAVAALNKVLSVLPNILDADDNLAITFAVTGSSSYFMNDATGREVRNLLSDKLGYTGYNLHALMNGESSIQIDTQDHLDAIMVCGSDYTWVSGSITDEEVESEEE